MGIRGYKESFKGMYELVLALMHNHLIPFIKNRYRSIKQAVFNKKEPAGLL
jgi:hypothetical protein